MVTLSSAAQHRGGFDLAETVCDTTLFHNRIGSMAGFYFPIYDKIPPCEWAVPNIMVAFPMPYKVTVIDR